MPHRNNQDIHSFARPEEAVVTHLDLDLTVNFHKEQISGRASLSIQNKTRTNKLYLDSHNLLIRQVTLEKEETKTSFCLGDEQPFIGRPLIVDILPETTQVHIDYATSPNAEALKWLKPAQTTSGKHPFLFTQSEAILARTWIPCQDSPGVRMTYRARIQTPPGLMAAMSAENSTRTIPDGLYQFSMPHPVPAYLLALAVGDLEFRAIGPRCGVYAEPQIVEKAAWEFVDIEKMLAAAEMLYGPYRWGHYDVIVLPPSFPFGGMENPRLNFLSPTIIANDRSLVTLIAHELAHSWSGNLVTNATWNDFWINEGFTVYFERRVMEVVSGIEHAELQAALGYHDLLETIAQLGTESPDTHLYLNLANRNPDDGMTDIAYEKGYFFLRMIEETVGRKKWDAFLRKYFDIFTFQTMNTQQFIDYLRKKLIHGKKDLEEKLQLDRWVYGPGLPENCAQVCSRALKTAQEQAEVWVKGKPAQELQTTNWSPHEWLHFFHCLPGNLSKQQMAELDSAFRFTDSHNAEILSAWLQQVVVNEYELAYPAVEKFLLRVGRRKFLKPLYTLMAKTPQGLEMAQRIYEKARPRYHSIATATIDALLGITNP